MKNSIKLIVAVMGITVATFGSLKANALKIGDPKVRCISYGFCGTTDSGQNIDGRAVSIPQ